MIANSFEQLADQYCNIASQHCNIARKRTSGLALKYGETKFDLKILANTWRNSPIRLYKNKVYFFTWKDTFKWLNTIKICICNISQEFQSSTFYWKFGQNKTVSCFKMALTVKERQAEKPKQRKNTKNIVKLLKNFRKYLQHHRLLRIPWHRDM